MIAAAVAAMAVAFPSPGRAADAVPDVPSEARRAGGDEHKSYLLIGPKRPGEPPKGGYGLILVLPGGDGSAAFQPFVKRIFKNSVPDSYLAAQMIAVKWSPGQEITWPTLKNRVKAQRFSTEQFIEALVADVRTKYPLNKKKILALAWSSGGPAAYAASLQEKTSVTGCFIAMSVFRPEWLPPLRRADARAYFIYHSPQDKTCPFHMAQQALAELKDNGAAATLVKYKGGHGWHGNVFDDVRGGILWLDRIAGEAPQTRPGKAGAVDSESGPNLNANGGFEQGARGWIIANNSRRSTIQFDRQNKSQGGQSLRITKKGGMPLDIIRHNVPNLPEGRKVSVSAMVRAEGAGNSWLKFFVWDAGGEVLIEDLDIAQIRGTFEWKRIERTFSIPRGAKSAAVQFWMVMGGTVWLDDVLVRPTESAPGK